MTAQEYQELAAHADTLERVAKEMVVKSQKERYSQSRNFFAGAASAYDIQAVWLRGFLRRQQEERIERN